jgi:two-component system osmolarity sensor histidine kinase EnvZ
VRDHDDMRININLQDDLVVLADGTELARVISNLLENARRYGKTPGRGVAQIDIAAKAREDWVLLKVRDHGAGVDPAYLANLSEPFFRGDAARTAATGAGLGLSIVDKAIQRMGGVFQLANTTSGGLAAHIKLHRANRVRKAEEQRATPRTPGGRTNHTRNSVPDSNFDSKHSDFGSNH